MNNYTTQQEVLLVTGSQFACRQNHQNISPDSKESSSPIDSLKEACWNGLLREMLPEVFALTPSDANLYMWQIRESEGFFAMEMGEYPEPLDYFFSIDPYSFSEYLGEN